MPLKKLQIHGFKSFKDRISLDFHEGITAIVGPNGCGKSNIADAFRWVLGETSLRQLRGKKMEDVIFAGTSTKKESSSAEVTLTLSNLQGETEELEITRRFFRSGETEFFINGKRVRLRDVSHLFLDSGIGKSAFALFEQGNIDEIIQKTPKERRIIFEEAAGILRFFERKKEAERKLELAEENISRVALICKEIEVQMRSLRVQAKEREAYQEKKDLLQDLERKRIFFKFQTLNQEKGRCSRERAQKKEEILSLEKEYEDIGEKLSTKKVLLEKKERASQEMNEALFLVRSERQAKLREKESLRERMQEALGRLISLKKEKESLQEIEKKCVLESERIEEKIAFTQKKESEMQKTLQLQKSNFHHIEKMMSQSEKAESELREEKFQLVRIEKELEGKIREAKARLEFILEKKKKAETEKFLRKKTKEELSLKCSDQKKAVSDFLGEVDERKACLETYENEEKELKERITLIEKELAVIERSLIHQEARKKFLFQLKEDMEGATLGFKKLMKECSQEKSPLYRKVRPLFEVIKPKGELKSLLIQVLRPYSETFLAMSEEAFSLSLEFIKNHNLQDISLLSYDALEEREGPLEERISSHFLKKAKKTKTYQEALALIFQGKAAFVSVEDGGSIDAFSIYTKKQESEKNAFLRESEIEELKKSLNQSDIQRKKTLETHLFLKEKRGEIGQQKFEKDKELRRSEMRQLESNFLLQKILSDLEKSIKEEMHFQKEEEEAKEELLKLKPVLDELQEHYSEKKSKYHALEEKGVEISSLYEETKLECEKKRASIFKLQKEVDELSFSLLRLEGERKILFAECQERERKKERLQEEILQLEEWKEKWEEKRLTFEDDLTKAEELLTHYSHERGALETLLQEEKQGILQLEEKEKEKLFSLTVCKEIFSKIEIKEAEFEGELRSQSEIYLKVFQERIEEAQVDIPQDFKPFDVEMRVNLLSKEIAEMEGRINMMSIHELKKQEERKGFLEREIHDMQQSKKEILEIIASLDEESRFLFKETFTKIRLNFQKNFKILFGEGGEADLELIDFKDILEAGVEIIAKPPGKKMRSLNLLSGGEKCLTSMALLFSIFEIKPAPFCILDEIDAPLDDTNVERFLNVVKTFASSCQFIIITHNKRTMAIADTLFGVSMEELGISKLLSMRFMPVSIEEH